MLRDHVQSYKDLPKYTYQFQTKFRNELRSKSGIIRGREFLMKDMYSFNRSQADLDEFYDSVIEAYKNVFARAGIGERTYLTFASGGMFSKYSHEFQTVCDAGEDHIYIDKDKAIAVNDEVMQDDILSSLGITRSNLVKEKSIEVGNIFKYGTRYTSELGLKFKDESGEDKPVIFGAYGIGLGRLMGTIVELLSDEKGIVWPESVAPYKMHLLALDEDGKKVAEIFYLGKEEEILYDDRDVSAGEKFADADLIGIPTRLVASKKSLASGGFESRDRRTGSVKIIPNS